MPISLLYEVGRVAQLTGTLVEDALAGSELNGTDFAVYSFLLVNGPATVSEVAESTGTKSPNTSKLLSKAERLGHLSRRTNPEDGRSTIVELTAAGREAHAAVSPPFGAALRRVNEGLAGSIEDVTWALERLAVALAAAVDGRVGANEVARAGARSLHYPGPPLSSRAEDSVREYIEFVRWQEGQGS